MQFYVMQVQLPKYRSIVRVHCSTVLLYGVSVQDCWIVDSLMGR